MESHSVLGTLWAGLGMGSYYVALIWIQLLLATFLAPLFLIPMTWLLDKRYRRDDGTAAGTTARDPYTGEVRAR